MARCPSASAAIGRRQVISTRDGEPTRSVASAVRQRSQAGSWQAQTGWPPAATGFGLRLEIGFEIVQHQQDRLVPQRAHEIARQPLEPLRAGELRVRVAVDGIGGAGLHVIVVAAQLAAQLQIDVAQRGIEAEGVRLGLVEQHPLEARLPQRQRLGGERRLAHAAQAGDHRHRLHLRPVLEPMKSEPSPASSQVRPTKCSWPAGGQFGDLVQPGIARIEGRAAALDAARGRAAPRRRAPAWRDRRRRSARGRACLPIEQRLARHGQGRRDILRLRVGEQRAVELHRQLAGVVVAHGIAHRHDRRHAALQQRVGGAGVAGLLSADITCVVRVLRLLSPGSLPWATARKSFQSARAGCRRSGRR